MEAELCSAVDGDAESLHSDDEGEDPCRIQIELDMLNNASDSINKLETELQKARNQFTKAKTQAGTQLNEMLKKTGKRTVKAAFPYYRSLKLLQEAQFDAQKAAVKYQDAHGAYVTAKKAVRDAEEQLALEDKETVKLLDSACQEILNRATIALFNAEKEKMLCERDHHTKTSKCAEHQRQVALLLKDKPQAIQKAKQFYDLRDVLEMKLKMEKQNAEDLQLALVCNKQKYRHALNNLEHISEEVHARRKTRLLLPPRTPGVGAEAESEFSDLPSSVLDVLSDRTSHGSLELQEEDECREMDMCDESHHENDTAIPVSKGEEEIAVGDDDTNALCREELLEGAENVRDTGFIEQTAACTRDLLVEKTGTDVSHAAQKFVTGSEVTVESGSAAKASEASSSSTSNQKRSMAVRDLPKGIYVATSGVASKSSATGNEKSSVPEASSDQPSSGGQKKLQQFPLLEGLVCPGIAGSSHQKF